METLRKPRTFVSRLRMKLGIELRFRHLAALWAAGSFALATVTAACFWIDVNVGTTGFVFLLVVVLLSLLDSFISSAIFSVIAVGCLDYFFTEPLYTFDVAHVSDFITLFTFLFTSLSITTLVRRVKRMGEATRKQAELLLRANDAVRRTQETYLAEAQQLSKTGSFGWNYSDGEIFWSEESFKIFGYEPQSKVTMEMVLQRVHPEDLGYFQEIVGRAGKDQKDFDFEHRLLMPDGTVKHLHVVAHVVKETADKLQFMGASMDITGRKQADDALRNSEQRYRYIFDQLPIALWSGRTNGTGALLNDLRSRGVIDLGHYIDEHPDFLNQAMDGDHVTEMNQRAVQLFGARDPQESAGVVRRFWHESPHIYRQLLESRFREEHEFQAEMRFTAFDERVFQGLFFVMAYSPAEKMEGMVLAGFVDETDRARAQEMLQQVRAQFAHAARISLLGELTASIAHEINQPLAAITANGEAALRWLNRPEPAVAKVDEILKRIVDDGRRAAKIIARIRGMAAGRGPQYMELSLNDVVEESIEFLRKELQAQEVTISLGLASALPQVRGDRTQLQQVIANLAINATQAMAQSAAAHRVLLIRTNPSDTETVTCTFEDSGPGIGPEQLDHLFNSFFTTKDSGMGMGLPISRSIIESHGGQIQADNKSAYGGARLSFVLPIANATIH